MRRFLSLYLPNWSIDLATYQRKVAGKEPNSVTALVKSAAQQLVIERISPAGYRTGIREGMSLTLARAITPTLSVASYNETADRAALHQLAVKLLVFSPFAGVEPERAEQGASKIFDGILLDITGTERIHGTEQALARRIHSMLSQLGVASRIGIAPTIGAAWAIARYGTVERCSDQNLWQIKTGEIRQALAALPISALRLPHELIESLRQLGITELKQLYRLPRLTIPPRFGKILLLRIEQALGSIDEVVNPVTIQAPFRVEHEFEHPLLNHSAIVRASMLLLEQTLSQLAAMKRKASTFVVKLEGYYAQREHGEKERFSKVRSFSLYAASNELKQIESIVSPLLEAIQLPGKVDTVTISALDSERAFDSQDDFTESADARIIAASIDEVMNKLVSRLGHEQVRTLQFQESYIPERDNLFAPIDKREAKPSMLTASSELPAINRPSHILATPEKLEAICMLPDNPPAWVKWKGASLNIVSGIGPERISPEWWRVHSDKRNGGREDHNSEDRDYFKLQDESGRWLWVYRKVKSQQWFLQGIWG